MEQLEENPESPPTKPNVRSTLSKTAWLLRTAVVEPFFFLFMLSYSCRSVTFTEIIQDKVCRNDLEYNVSVCGDLQNKNYTQELNEVQKMTNTVHMYITIIAMVPAIIVNTLTGSFSDKYGRKMPILVASSSLILDILIVILCLTQKESSSYLLLLSAIPGGLTGGMVVTMTLTMSHLSQTTAPDERPLRFTLMEIAMIVAYPSGALLGGYVRQHAGFLYVLLCALAFLLLSVVWMAFRMEERGRQKIGDWRRVPGQLFSLDNVRENLRTTFKERPRRARPQIFLLIFAISLYLLAVLGMASIGFMYTQKRYGWTNMDYSLVSAGFSLLQAASMAIAVPVLTKLLRMPDSLLIVVGGASNAAKLVVWSLASDQYFYFTGCFAGLLSGLLSVGTKSRLSKLIQFNEIGKVFSTMAMFESLMPLIGNALWPQIYNKSIESFPGLAYLVAAFLMAAPIFTGISILLRCRKPPDYSQSFDTDMPAVVDTIQQDKVQPDTVQQDKVQHDTVQPDTVQQDKVQQDTVQPDTVQQDKVQQDKVQQEKPFQRRSPKI